MCRASTVTSRPSRCPPRPRVSGKYFGSKDMCMKYRNKWVSGVEWWDEFYAGSSKTWPTPSSEPSDPAKKGSYGRLDKCASAEAYGVKHLGS